MSTEIKAKGDELVEKYLKMEYGILQEYFPSTNIKVATKCAIIAVEEIIKTASSVRHYGDMQLTEYGYWNEVLNYLKSKL